VPLVFIVDYRMLHRVNKQDHGGARLSFHSFHKNGVLGNYGFPAGEVADNETFGEFGSTKLPELPVIRQRQYMNRGFEQLSPNLYTPVFYTLYVCHDLSSRS